MPLIMTLLKKISDHKNLFCFFENNLTASFLYDTLIKLGCSRAMGTSKRRGRSSVKKTPFKQTSFVCFVGVGPFARKVFLCEKSFGKTSFFLPLKKGAK